MVDASDEDLPAEWVKKKKQDGTFYYFNATTGKAQSNSPHEEAADAIPVPAAARPRGVARIFKVRWRKPGRD